ncbi:MAG: hypothetical protein IMZ47_03140 [Firmicutes bacterium]|nr:hypothetical protein [Bacillota bacterium]
MEETNVENAEEIQNIETHLEMLMDPEEQERIGASIVGPGGHVRDISFRVFRVLSEYRELKEKLNKYEVGENQIQITSTFVAGDGVDPDLLLESVEAACMDMIYDKDALDQRANWGDTVKFIQASLTADKRKGISNE